jgi:hypothetical protein
MKKTLISFHQTSIAYFVSIFFLFTILLLIIPLPSRAERTADNVSESTGMAVGATPTQIQDALGLIPSDVISISAGASDGLGFKVFDIGATSFPTQGSDYFVMSTGSTVDTLTANTSPSTSTILSGLNNSQGNDMVQTVLVLQPPAGATCLAFDFAYYSEEFPEWVSSRYNDAFIAEIDQTTFQIVNDQVIAPNNFAFDAAGDVISVNTTFSVTAGNAGGTTYDAGTPLLIAKTPIKKPGPITVILSITDLGDSIYDSTVFIDNFRWLYGISCEPGADVDTDQDALLDSWEIHGIDFDKDGSVDLDLPAMGADPNHKDIFVEIDYMFLDGVSGHTHKPKLSTLQKIIDAFENAPVMNPDGTTGIHIHIDAGTNTIMNPVTGELWNSRSQSDSLTHHDNLGTCSAGDYNWTAFDSTKGVGVPGNFSIQRGDVFHYSIWAHNLCPEFGGTSGISRGIPGSDFLVTLGDWTNSVGTVSEQAGTFIHELGHNLSLKHGGNDHKNYKPNYISVMNYAFQTRGVRISGADGNFDYSRFLLPELDENHLDEPIGLCFDVGDCLDEATNYGTRFYNPIERIVNVINNPINWNSDGDTIDTSVSRDINGDGATTILGTTDNWDEIAFNGGAVGHLGENIIQPKSIDEPGLLDIDAIEDANIFTDIAVSVTGPSTVHLKPGSSMVYSYKVTNVGDSEEKYNIEAIATKTWANFPGLPTSIKLKPDEFATFNIQITIPLGTSSDESDLLTVRAYSLSNSAIEDTIETSILISVNNAINLLDFNQVGNVLTWTTASEVNNAGYYVWVGIPTFGQCGDKNTQYDRVKKLTNELIPAKGGLSEGAFYTYEVPPSESNVTLCYGIEDINTEGLSTFHIIPNIQK